MHPNDCELTKRFGVCSMACSRWNILCQTPPARPGQWTARDYLREALISFGIVAGLTYLALTY